MENPTFKCKGCGNELNAANAESGVVVCEYCGMARTVPKRETKPAALSYLMLAEHDLDVCAFDNAFTGYKKAAEADGEEPEAYFGMALARFNVQYLKDLTGQKIRLQPICHEVSGKKFCEDANYRKALEKATSAQRAEYERKGKEIDYIRREFEKLEAEGLDYDCFLCVKVTDDETKLRTKDYKRADDIYFNLRKKGYKPFFSERELDDVTGADYEARILYALYSSECMIVVCGNENYLQTPWVKNEYTRFLKLIGDEEKESDSIALAWFSSPIEKLAGKRGKIQGINLDALDASERITAFVENHTPEAKKRREEERARKTQEAEEARRKLLEEQENLRKEFEEKQRALAEEQKRAQRELEERLKGIKQGGESAPHGGVSATVNSLLTRARQEREAKNDAKAREYYGRILDAEPQNADAWWGLFLADCNAADEEEAERTVESIEQFEEVKINRNFINAKKYASGKTAEAIEQFEKNLRTEEPLLKRARAALKKGEYTRAKDLCRLLLAFEPENAKGFYTLSLAEEKIQPNALKNGNLVAIPKNQNYLNAKKYASGDFKEELGRFDGQIKKCVDELAEQKQKEFDALVAEKKALEKEENQILQENGRRRNELQSEREQCEQSLEQLNALRTKHNRRFARIRKLIKTCWICLPIFTILAIGGAVSLYLGDYSSNELPVFRVIMWGSIAVVAISIIFLIVLTPLKKRKLGASALLDMQIMDLNERRESAVSSIESCDEKAESDGKRIQLRKNELSKKYDALQKALQEIKDTREQYLN